MARKPRLALEKYKQLLLESRRKLLKIKGKAEDDFVRSLADEERGGDSADGNAPNEAARRRSEELGRRIQEVDAALSRIDRGTFGNCLKGKKECTENEGNGKIPAILLRKDPTRIYCDHCQESENEEAERKRSIANFRSTIPCRGRRIG